MQYKSKLIQQVVKKYKLTNKKRVTLEFLERISLDQKILLKNLIFILGISRASYYNLKRNFQKTTFLNLSKEFNDIKEKVEFIKIELKYLAKYGSRYYNKNQIKYICSKNKITVDNLLQYINPNPKHYKFNKLVLKNNKNGFWIGSVTNLTNEFIESNYEDLNRVCNRAAHQICRQYNNYGQFDEFLSLGWEKLIEKGGIIEKNFQFDKNLQMNILCVKIKYFIFGYHHKCCKEIYYEETSETIDRLSILSDNRNDPAKVLETQLLNEEIPKNYNMKGLNKKIIEIINENIDMFENGDRANVLNFIAHNLGISCEKLECSLVEIQNIILENNVLEFK